MRHLICRQKIADFSDWKAVFDSHAAAQRSAGLEIAMILRNIDDASEVFMLFRVTDAEGAKDFVTSPDVSTAQEEAGVEEGTEILFLM